MRPNVKKKYQKIKKYKLVNTFKNNSLTNILIYCHYSSFEFYKLKSSAWNH